jgi:hypothetical protein
LRTVGERQAHHPEATPAVPPAEGDNRTTLDELGFPGRTLADLTPEERAAARERLEALVAHTPA